MKKILTGVGMLMLCVPVIAAPPANHLVISEMAVRGGLYNSSHESSEFTEIYNPTGSAVLDLENYYISDWADYGTLPQATRDSLLPDLGAGDHLLRFPNGTSIASGQLVVVTANGQYFLNAYFGGSLSAFQTQPGLPQLFEAFDSDPLIPNMVNLNQNVTADSTNLSHSDGGENQFLFYWDGATDLVKDVDILLYAPIGVDLGFSNGFTPKTGTTSDGPDVDLIDSPYFADNGTTDNLTSRFLNGPSSERPFQFQRRSLIEVGELLSGGNGITGHDESMELGTYTWGAGTETTATATPGVTTLTLSSVNQPPVIYDAKRLETFPQQGDGINFQAQIEDDGSVSQANLNIDTGSGYTIIPMVHGSGNTWAAPAVAPANGTVVKWFITATDNNSVTASSNDYKFYSQEYPGYESFTVGLTPIANGDLQFSEINFDTVGGDNAGESEFVEVHNTTASPIDLTGYVFTRGDLDTTAFRLITPSGYVIQPHDYVVYAAFKPLFLTTYTGFDPDKVIDLNWQRSSVLANSADTVTLVNPNQTSANGESSLPADVFSYSGQVAGTGAGNLGFTLELKDVDGPNDDMINWDVSATQAGSPGERSTIDNPGTIAIINTAQTAQFPTSATPIVINSDVTGANAPLTVELNYMTGYGYSYTSVPMAISAGNTYTKNLGTFANGTLIKYFIKVTDSLGQIKTYPPYTAPLAFYVNDTPITDQDLLFTEIMSDPTNAENVDFSEWMEIRNRRATPIDMSYFKVGHNLNTGPYPRVLPEGTVIAPNGFIVFGGNKPVFMNQYTTVNPNIVVDAYYVASIIANGSGNAFITHANQINYNGLTWQDPGTPFESVAYYDNANGWPNYTNNVSIELTDITLDNNVGANWINTTVTGGTPGASNSTSAVSDWSIY